MGRGIYNAVALCVLLWLLPSEAFSADAMWREIAQPKSAEIDAKIKNALAAQQAKNWTLAEKELQEALAIDPARVDTLAALGELHSAQKRWSACADAFREAVYVMDAGEGADDELLFESAFCLAMAGRHREAIALYLRYSPTIGSRSDMIRNWNLADSWMALGDLARAIASYRIAAAQTTKESVPWFGLAVALDRDDQQAAAKRAVGEGLRMDPLAADINAPAVYFDPPEEKNYLLGLIAEARGETSSAMAHFRRFVAAAPNGPWVRGAEKHLAGLHGPLPAEREISIFSSDRSTELNAAIASKVRGAWSAMSGCLDKGGNTGVRVTVLRYFRMSAVPASAPPRSPRTSSAPPRPGSGKPPVHAGARPPAAGSFTRVLNETSRVEVTAIPGLSAPSLVERICLENEVLLITWPKREGKGVAGSQSIVFPVIAPAAAQTSALAARLREKSR